MNSEILKNREGVLKSGERLVLRMLGPGDIPAMQVLFKTFSPQTIFHRFQEPIPVMTEERARRCVGCTSEGSFAVAAAYEDPRRGEVLVGIARLGMFAPGEAEFAIVVGDPWQRQGVGRLLVDASLAVAADRGIKWLESTFDLENRRYLDFCSAVGLNGTLTWEMGQLRLRVPVTGVDGQADHRG